MHTPRRSPAPGGFEVGEGEAPAVYWRAEAGAVQDPAKQTLVDSAVLRST